MLEGVFGTLDATQKGMRLKLNSILEHDSIKIFGAIASAAGIFAAGIAVGVLMSDSGSEQLASTSSSTAAALGSTSDSALPSNGLPTTARTTTVATSTGSIAATTLSPTPPSDQIEGDRGPGSSISLREVEELTRTATWGNATIDAVDYDEVLLCEEFGSIEVALDRQFGRFTATVGHPQDVTTGTAGVFFVTDEQENEFVFPISFGGYNEVELGDTWVVDIDVSNVLRLRLGCAGGGSILGFANPTLVVKE